jgi:hypothetical protein
MGNLLNLLMLDTLEFPSGTARVLKLPPKVPGYPLEFSG